MKPKNANGKLKMKGKYPNFQRKYRFRKIFSIFKLPTELYFKTDFNFPKQVERTIK